MKKIVSLSKLQIISKNEITNILNSVRSTYDYARFNLYNGIYLTITYHRDNTVDIFTNSRDLDLYHQIQNLNRSYTQMRIVEFVFRWISKLNK